MTLGLAAGRRATHVMNSDDRNAATPDTTTAQVVTTFWAQRVRLVTIRA